MDGMEGLGSPDAIMEEGKERMIVNGILGKVEKSIAETDSVRWAASLGPMLTKITAHSLPSFAYDQAKGTFNVVRNFAAEHGLPYYEYNPSELLWATLLLLNEQGRFTPEEKEFIRVNNVVLMRIIFESAPLLERGKRQPVEERNMYTDRAVPSMVLSALKAVREAVLTVGWFVKPREVVGTEIREKGENPRTGKKPVDVVAMHELQLLDMPAMEMLAAKKCMPDEPKIDLYRRILSIPADATESEAENIIKSEERLLKQVNMQWRSIVERYYGGEKLKRYGFSKKVKETNDFIELYQMLVGDTADIHDVNSARIKLLLYLAISKARNNLAYVLGHSIKSYLDKYLQTKIFSDITPRTLYVRVDRESYDEKVSVSTERGPESGYKIVRVWEATIKNPTTGEEMRVYLYMGDDEKASGEDETLDIVNRKSIEKIALKELSEQEEPIDFHRITVVPAENSEEELAKLRTFLDQDLTHPQSRHISWVKKRRAGRNRGTSIAYRKAKAQNVPVIVSPYCEGRRGYIRDIMTGRPVRIGSVNLEVRTGTTALLAEKHSNSITHHGAYTQIRMGEVLGKLLPPEIYKDNWLPTLGAQIARILADVDSNLIFPGRAQIKVQELRRSVRRGAREVVQITHKL